MGNFPLLYISIYITCGTCKYICYLPQILNRMGQTKFQFDINKSNNYILAQLQSYAACQSESKFLNLDSNLKESFTRAKAQIALNWSISQYMPHHSKMYNAPREDFGFKGYQQATKVAPSKEIIKKRD